MSDPYSECSKCVAKPFCKIYKGEYDIPSTKRCNSKRFLDKALSLAVIPPEYLGADRYRCNVDNENIDLVKKLDPYLKNILEEVDNGRNFVFVGEMTGMGKTYMASAVLNNYIYKACQTTRFDYEHPIALFVDYVELMDTLRYSEDDDVYFNTIKNVPLLLLDDMGAGTMSDFVREQTFLIINYRHNHRLSTVVTSNVPLERWASDNMFGKRITSRILKDPVLLEVKGSDRR